MDYLYEPMDDSRAPAGFEPLEWDDEECEDDDCFDDPYAEEVYEEYEEEEYGLGGFDDLKPFGSFNDGVGWDDTLF